MQTERTQEVSIHQKQTLIISNPLSKQLMQCLGADDEVGLIVFEKNLSISKAIEGTKLKKLEKEVGEINTIVAICYLLNRFAAEFNVGKSLTKQQAAHLAADIVEKYVRKGSKVYVEGQLQTRKWTDQSGQERFTTEVVIGRFRGELTLLDNKSSGGDADYSGGGYDDSSFAPKASGKPAQKFDELDDDVPF